jgi:hypothetical protein
MRKVQIFSGENGRGAYIYIELCPSPVHILRIESRKKTCQKEIYTNRIPKYSWYLI